MHDDVYEALYQALTNSTVQPARRTFGKVEYVFIPVSVVEGILEDQWAVDEPVDAPNEEDFSDEPAVFVGTPLTGFPDDEASSEVAVASDDSGDEEE